MAYDPNRWTTAVRMFATGKARFRADGDAKFAKEVNEAFKKGARLTAYLEESVFVASLRDAGVPDAVIEEYLRTYDIEDGAFFDRSWT
jgi:hypothetical protein